MMWSCAILCLIVIGLNHVAVDNLFLGIILISGVLIDGLFYFSQLTRAGSKKVIIPNRPAPPKIPPLETLPLRDQLQFYLNLKNAQAGRPL